MRHHIPEKSRIHCAMDHFRDTARNMCMIGVIVG
jgi:hypothetical protein